MRRKAITAVGMTAAVVAALGTSPASAATGEKGLPGVTVVARGLYAPQGINFGPDGRLYVAETRHARISKVNVGTGSRTTVLSNVTGLSGVDVAGNGTVYGSVSVESAHPNGFQGHLVKAGPGGKPVGVANLIAYELAHNPDGQDQSADDALSNPYAVLRMAGRTLVADAGANDVLSVSDSGKVTTFFAPRTINTGHCKGAPNNDPQHPGCDPVPTGLAMGPDGYVYVSGLGALAPNAARVWKLNPRTGKVVRTIGNLSTINGVAVGPDGSVYASNLLYGAPKGNPGPGFDPTNVGRVVRIKPDGSRTYAHVTLPGGLTWHGGKLYAASWILAADVGLPASAGQVVTVAMSAFRSTPE